MAGRERVAAVAWPPAPGVLPGVVGLSAVALAALVGILAVYAESERGLVTALILFLAGFVFAWHGVRVRRLDRLRPSK